ncbi:hypothetical protein D9M72_652120 [compost metagenome]
MAVDNPAGELEIGLGVVPKHAQPLRPDADRRGAVAGVEPQRLVERDIAEARGFHR